MAPAAEVWLDSLHHSVEKIGVCHCFMPFLQPTPLPLSFSKVLRIFYLFFFSFRLVFFFFSLRYRVLLVQIDKCVTGNGNWNEGWLHVNVTSVLHKQWQAVINGVTGETDCVDRWHCPGLLSGSCERSRRASTYIYISLVCLKHPCTPCLSFALFIIFT